MSWVSGHSVLQDCVTFIFKGQAVQEEWNFTCGAYVLVWHLKMKAQQSFKVSRTPHQSQCYHIPKDLNIQSAIWIFWICLCVCVCGGGFHLRYLSCRGVLIFGFVNTHDICHVLISIFDSEQYHLSFTAECCEGHDDNTTDLWWCSSQSGSIPVTSLVDAVLILTQKTRQLKGSWWILQC